MAVVKLKRPGEQNRIYDAETLLSGNPVVVLKIVIAQDFFGLMVWWRKFLKHKQMHPNQIYTQDYQKQANGYVFTRPWTSYLKLKIGLICRQSDDSIQ